jgi:ABC-2 type transport system ATP-binding protein
MSGLAIETHGLRKRFGAKLAVADLSLSVRRGEVFGFLGPNGAGKTTSLKMLLGLVTVTAGRASLLGAPVGDRKARARVGFLPEHFRFQDWLTGRELLHFHGRLFGIPKRTLAARTEELLARVNMVEAADRKIRVQQGHAAADRARPGAGERPELVFLDEPTSGLDPLGRRLVRDIIHELKARGTTVFLNSHLLGEVEITCDRVVFIKAGRTLHEMTLGDVSAATEVELRTGPLDQETLSGLARFGERLPTEAPNGLVRLRIKDDAALPEIARWLVGRGAELYEMHAAKKSLETWFLEAMGDDQAPG